MTLLGILLIIAIGALTFIIRSGNGGKNIYTIIVVLVSSIIALSSISCRSHHHDTQQNSHLSQMDLSYSHRIDSLFHALATKLSTSASSATSDVSVMDSTVEKEYTDSTGTKVRERATYHNEHHNSANQTANTEATQQETHTKADNNNIVSSYHQEYDDKKVEHDDKQPPSPILLNLIVILVGIIVIAATWYFCKRKSKKN